MWTAETALAERAFRASRRIDRESVEKKRVNPIEWKRSPKNVHVSLYIYIMYSRNAVHKRWILVRQFPAADVPVDVPVPPLPLSLSFSRDIARSTIVLVHLLSVLLPRFSHLAS